MTEKEMLMNIKNTAGMDNEYVEVIQSILEELSYDIDQFDLTGFKGIEIVDDSLLRTDSDGCTTNKLTQLPKRKMECYIDQDNLCKVKSTIFHEMIHVELSNKLPNIHKEFEQSVINEDIVKNYTIRLYIEYVAHKQSSDKECVQNKKEFYNSVNNYAWDFNNDATREYFIRIAGYIIGRDRNNKYLNQIINEELKNNLLEIKPVLEQIGVMPIIDDYMVLSRLEKIVSKYVSNF